MQNVEPENVFNGDEMGQFWRLMPSKSYVVKDNVCKFGKQSKERITIFVCGSMMGEKLKLTVIGKSEHPRNFDLINKLPLHYYNNKSAWMTADIFFDIVNKMNK